MGKYANAAEGLDKQEIRFAKFINRLRTSYRYFEKREPVIEHFQASRRFRAAVGFGVDMIKGQTT
jgi:hypothetical protein